ncbi:dirigent protein 24-like [Tripterygium wilfordii]|uniref:Dirigent protein n=1 Tax=Tripterygium wilfordii TaxID=458696 RepID=A0A7J7D8F0_TRIWF|nr:dirigent protein 9 [Tripterygium wilfordii]KAF5742645.1 dirigent protein 24-like [Tripterygium wilfordii]
MAKPSDLNKATICLLLLLSIAVGLTSSARILDEVDPQPQPLLNPTATTLPSGQTPAVTPTATDDEDTVDPPIPEPEASATVAAPVVPPATTAGTTTSATAANPGPDEVAAPAADEAPEAAPVAIAAPVTGAGTTATSATAANTGPHEPHLSFFMHDILGGSHPSARVVTGIIASSEINGIPFSKPNNNLFPLTGGTPLLNSDSLDNLINTNNLPLVAGLNGAQQSSTVIQTTGSRDNTVNSNNQPFVTAGNLPSGSTLQTLMFGSITVIDDQLTEGHELGSAVIGKAQGFYMASSLDGTSQTIALTTLFHGDHEHEHDLEDTISFFGVHRMASLGSQIAIVGGTGKYENARGYATVATLHHEDQHTTDGVDTILEFSVYLTE